MYHKNCFLYSIREDAGNINFHSAFGYQFDGIGQSSRSLPVTKNTINPNLSEVGCQGYDNNFSPGFDRANQVASIIPIPNYPIEASSSIGNM